MAGGAHLILRGLYAFKRFELQSYCSVGGWAAEKTFVHVGRTYERGGFSLIAPGPINSAASRFEWSFSCSEAFNTLSVQNNQEHSQPSAVEKTGKTKKLFSVMLTTRDYRSMT